MALLARSSLPLAALLALLLPTGDLRAQAPAPPTTQPASQPTTQPGTADHIGLRALAAELGPRLPTGRGVPVGHVEGNEQGKTDYLPNTKHRLFEGVTFHVASGPSGISGHADATARLLYGRDGLAPGVDQVLCYAAGHWLGAGLLRTGAPGPPQQPLARIYTNSWISDVPAHNKAILRRVDFLADRYGTLFVAGVNNQRVAAVPPLLAGAFNGIAVGQWDGNSSGGRTTGDEPGRCKPDIVAPGNLTSFATPVVAAAAARLLEAAGCEGAGEIAPIGAGASGNAPGNTPATAPAAAASATTKRPGLIPGIDPVARRPEVIKAVLLAGAAKPAGWSATPDKPLDDHLGAGRLRLDASHHILAGGRVAPANAGASAAAPRRAWAFAALKPGEHHDYVLESSAPAPPGEVSIILTWHRRIAGKTVNDLWNDKPVWLDTPRLADLDLALLRDTGAGPPAAVAQSVSRVDNVEHIHLPSLADAEARAATQPGFAPAAPGTSARWVVRVTRQDALDEAWDYALAWRFEEKPNRLVATQPAAATRPAGR